MRRLFSVLALALAGALAACTGEGEPDPAPSDPVVRLLDDPAAPDPVGPPDWHPDWARAGSVAVEHPSIPPSARRFDENGGGSAAGPHTTPISHASTTAGVSNAASRKTETSPLG